MAQGRDITPVVKCVFHTDDPNSVRLQSIEIITNVYRHKIDFEWAWAAPIILRDDVIDLFKGLIKRCFPKNRQDITTVHSRNFIAPLPGVRFEGLQFGHAGRGLYFMALRLTRGMPIDLFCPSDTEKNDSSLNDVFLPLTNLSAYLKAMKDQAGDDGPARAMALTADRLDEFLLVYGGRLQDVGGPIGMPSRR
ncbi:MAG: hypothetical protein AAF701_08485 [Pseudomonadota bacterium]